MPMSPSVWEKFQINFLSDGQGGKSEGDGCVISSATHLDKHNNSARSSKLQSNKMSPRSGPLPPSEKDNKCRVNAERMRCKCMQCCCCAPPDVFLAAAVSQLCAAPWWWEAGEGCLVTKCLVCSLFSRFWPSLNTPLWGERRWIGAPRLSTQRQQRRLTDGY